MKQIVAGGGRWITPTEDETEVAGILLSLPVFIEGRNFSWGLKKKRSVLDLKSPEEGKRSPSTPLCFLPSGSGSDGGGNGIIVKRKATDDLMGEYKGIQQEREILVKKIKAHHQELTSENLELKARGQKINYPRGMGNFHSCMKPVDQQSTHKVLLGPSNGKLVTMCCSSDSSGVGLVNQIDPRGEHCDYMASSHPLDQSSRYMMMASDPRVIIAAAARKRRMLRMKESKQGGKIHLQYDYMASSHPLDQSSRYLMMASDPRVMIAAAARKRRILRMKESKKSLKLSRPCR